MATYEARPDAKDLHDAIFKNDIGRLDPHGPHGIEHFLVQRHTVSLQGFAQDNAEPGRPPNVSGVNARFGENTQQPILPACQHPVGDGGNPHQIAGPVPQNNVPHMLTAQITDAAFDPLLGQQPHVTAADHGDHGGII